MKITHAGSTPSAKGPDDYFTGTVRLDKLFQAFAQASHQVRIRYLDLCQLLDDIGNRCFQLLA